MILKLISRKIQQKNDNLINSLLINKLIILYLNTYRYWGLGIGDWGLGPIPNPQSPIPNKYKTLI